MKIIDPRTNAPFELDTAVLKEDVAQARAMSVRRATAGISIASTLTPQRLASVLRNVAEGNDPESYMILAEEMEERDLHYSSVLRTRKLAVASIEPSIESASDDKTDLDLAQLVRDKLLSHPDIPELFFDLLDGLGKGVGVSQILWDTAKTPWVPREYKWVNPRWLRPDPDTLDDILLISDEHPTGAPLQPYKYIVHRPRMKSGIVWRNGLARLVAVMYMLKSFTVRDWWSFAEVFGIPIRIGKYGNNASPEDINTLVNAISTIASDAGAVIPESMKIEMVESGKGNNGNTLFQNMAEWCDKQISKAVLGQTMTTEDGASLSQAKVHNEVRMDIAKWDARQLETAINRDLIIPWVIVNFGVQERYPKVSIKVSEPEDLKAFVDALAPMVDRGLKVKASDVMDKFGLSQPEANEAVLMPQQQAAQPQPVALNRQQGLAINAVRPELKTDAEIADMTDAAMTDWVEVGGKEFINPILKLAAESDSYDAFMQRLPELQKSLNPTEFVTNMTELCWKSRAMGDVIDG